MTSSNPPAPVFSEVAQAIKLEADLRKRGVLLYVDTDDKLKVRWFGTLDKTLEAKARELYFPLRFLLS